MLLNLRRNHTVSKSCCQGNGHFFARTPGQNASHQQPNANRFSYIDIQPRRNLTGSNAIRKIVCKRDRSDTAIEDFPDESVGADGMSNDIFQERIDWTQVIPEIEKHILKSDTEFEQEWEARVVAKTTGPISRKWANDAKETSTAQAALDKILGDTLVSQECKRERILVLLYQYIGGDPEKVDAVKRGFQRQRDHMLNTADTLIKAANDVEQDFANLAFMGIQEYNTPEEDMRRSSKTLRDWANSVFKDLASERVSGRDHHLDALVKMVEEVTGTPHYAEIATLVDRVGLAYDPEFTKVIRDGESIYEATTPDAIRARIRRIRESGQPLFG